MHRAEIKKIFPMIAVLLTCSVCAGQQPAFPGAEGFGRFVSGGRGGQVIAVTNLQDRGPGSLRAAIDNAAVRTIVFRVSGTIALESPLFIRHGNLTIAGQTAPGGGICIRDFPVIIFADNIIIRYIRVRLGDRHKLAEDALSVFFQKDIIIDHCSFSWGTDEVLTVRDNERATVQWCIISESLNQSFHPKGAHGYGGIWGGKGASFHHNLIAHHASRTPRMNGSRYHGDPEAEVVDFRNNVIYNWGFNGIYGGEAGRQNVVANNFIPGPATKHRNRIADPSDKLGRWYVADNVVDGFPEVTMDNWAGGVQGEFWRDVRVDRPHPAAPVETQTAEEACRLVLARAGATLPQRDSVDSRIVAEVRARSSFDGGSGIINSQHAVGGWPRLHGADPPRDSDGDGMADAWELRDGLDPGDPDDRNGDSDGSGYTNLERYLHALTQEKP